MVGEDQSAAPDGPHIVTPRAFLPCAVGRSFTVYVCHTGAPVAASTTIRLPRNLQHSYVGIAPVASSTDDIGTNKRPLYSTGDPVMRAAGCSSSRRVHFSSPVAASSA